MQATNRQLFALHRATKLDTRGLGVTREQASKLIGDSMAGVHIFDDVWDLGARPSENLRAKYPGYDEVALKEIVRELVETRGASQRQPSREDEFEELWNRAVMAGREAGVEVNPPKFIPTQRANPLDDSSPIVKQWEPVTMCGSAYVGVKPGNSAFAKWLVKTGKAQRNDYRGGVFFSIWDYNQCVEKKMAHANAMARVFAEAGIQADTWDWVN